MASPSSSSAEASTEAAAAASAEAAAAASVEAVGAEPPQALELVQLANELVGRIFAHLLARAAELNLSLAEAKALQHLEPERAMPMRALASRLHANPSNVTVIVGRLESRGLLSRELGADRRVKGVRLTPLGAEQRARLEARLLADHPAVRGLSPDQQGQLVELLRHLTRAPA